MPLKLRRFLKKLKTLKLQSSELIQKLPYSEDPYLIIKLNIIFIGQ